MLRLILIGQAAFGADCLKKLLDQGEKVIGIITPPDRSVQTNPLKEAAIQLHIPILQPNKLKDPEALSWVRALQPDLLVLSFVTDFVPQEMIALAPLGGINYHPSLLPKYRGGTAMNWAIINGETETGVTIHQIDKGVDTGPILLQEKVMIDPDDTVKSLYFNKLYPLGIRMVAEVVRLIREGKAHPLPQDGSQASYQPLIKEKDVIIDWTRPMQKVYNLIRGSNPHPGATTYFRNEKLKIWEGRPYPGQGFPGKILMILEDRSLVVAAGDGSIQVRRIQYQSKEKGPTAEFILTHQVQIGESFGMPNR